MTDTFTHQIAPEHQAMLERGVPSLRAAITEYSDHALLELIDVAKLRIREGVDTPIDFARVATVYRCLREEAAQRGLSTPPDN